MASYSPRKSIRKSPKSDRNFGIQIGSRNFLSEFPFNISGFRGLNVTAESIPAVSMRTRNQILRFQWDHRNQCRGLNETAETNDKNFQFYLRIFGCSLPEPHNFSSRIPRSQWDQGIGFRGLNETAESVPTVSMRPQNQISRSQWDCGNFMTPRESLQKLILVLIPFKGKLSQKPIHNITWLRSSLCPCSR
jgi:hypothetical protein